MRLDAVAVEPAPRFPNPCADDDALASHDEPPPDVEAYLSSIPDELAGRWLAHPGSVMVVAVTGGAERHREALPGICVTDEGFDFTETELQEAGDDLLTQQARWQEEGWRFTMGYGDVIRNRYVVRFDLLDHRLVDEIDERWGGRIAAEGTVEVLDGTVDDIVPPASPESAVTIDTVVRGSGRMAALGTFVLRHDRALDCLYLESADGTRTKPVWPFGTYVTADPVRVRDGRGAVIATVDQPFSTGGGQSLPPEPDDALACGATDSWVM